MDGVSRVADRGWLIFRGAWRRGLRRCSFDGQFQRIEDAAGVAVGHVHQMGQGVIVNLHVELAVPAFGIRQRLARDGEEVILGQRLELEDAGAADQRLVDLEIGVLGGGADEDHGAVFHPRQQRVLLRLVEPMNLIHEQDGALAELTAPLLRGRDSRADIGHAGQHRVDGDEVGACGVGDNPRQGRLTRARRPVKDDRAQLIGLDGATQQPARPDDVFLADELVQGARPHARCQGCFLLRQFLAAGVKEIRGFAHGVIVPRSNVARNVATGYNACMHTRRPPTDLRAHRKRTDRNLALAVVIFLVGVGGALIALIYGAGAAVLGLTCLLFGAGLFGLLWLILTLLERWADRDA